MNFEQLEKKLKTNFKDKGLLKQAFIHRSYINENRNLGLEHNERLEFLGDAVLELAITDYLYKKYTTKPEGELTAYRSALVNALTLSDAASLLDFNEYLFLSKGESKDTGRARQYILANTFEAVIGAIYIDQGYEKSKEFIANTLFGLIEGIIEKGTYLDAKSRFQERAQEKVGVTPAYKTLRETGPDHDKQFTIGLYLGSDLVVEGSGKSKQEAEQEAARKGLDKKGW